MKTIIIDGIEYNLTPKVLFKKGDFVVIQETTYLISKIEGINVTLFCNGRECLFDIDVLKNARLWDIFKDAKDGDVLCYKDEISLYRHDIKNCTKQETTFGGFVYYCCYDGKRFVVDSLYSLTEQDKMDIHPATKEQRDTLGKIMTDAGYTFDFEKKELKKIVAPIFNVGDTIAEKNNSDIHDFGSFTITDITGGKYWYNDRIICDITEQDEWEIYEPVRQKSVEWNKEDEEMIIKICQNLHDYPHIKSPFDDESFNEALKEVQFIKSLKDRIQPKVEWSKDDEYYYGIIQYILNNECVGKTDKENAINWFKSFKERYTWKPSDEQMEALNDVISSRDIKYDVLSELWKDLKKLREE